MTLGQRIQELRKQQDLSQEALGEKLGVSRQAVSRWEMDGAVPEVDKLIALSKLFGVSINDLLGVDGTPEQGGQSGAAAQTRGRRPWLLILFIVLLALSIALNVFFSLRFIRILDPPQAPSHPVRSAEYAYTVDYPSYTYDMTIKLTEWDPGSLKGYDTLLYVIPVLAEGETLADTEYPVSFKNGEAVLRLEDLPWRYNREISFTIVYEKSTLWDKLHGTQSLMSMHTHSGTWDVTASGPPVTENTDLLLP